MRIGLVSQAGGRDGSLDKGIEDAKRAESEGFESLSLPNIFGLDAVAAAALAGRETERIELVTGVVPVQPRHPMALAQAALTAQAAARGRFTLGIGLSHQPVIEGMMGLSFARPARRMREYLEVLGPLLQGRPVSFQGELYRVNAGLQVEGGTPVPVLVAALGPAMLAVAGRYADGTVTWMTGLKTLAGHIVPRIREAAKDAGRPEPRVVAGMAVALTRDKAAARERAGRMFQGYGRLASYRAMLDLEGAESPGAVAVVGDEGELRDELRRLDEAGVTDLSASPFPAEEGSLERTRDFLAAEARGGSR